MTNGTSSITHPNQWAKEFLAGKPVIEEAKSLEYLKKALEIIGGKKELANILNLEYYEGLMNKIKDYLEKEKEIHFFYYPLLIYGKEIGTGEPKYEIVRLPVFFVHGKRSKELYPFIEWLMGNLGILFIDVVDKEIVGGIEDVFRVFIMLPPLRGGIKRFTKSIRTKILGRPKPKTIKLGMVKPQKYIRYKWHKISYYIHKMLHHVTLKKLVKKFVYYELYGKKLFAGMEGVGKKISWYKHIQTKIMKLKGLYEVYTLLDQGKDVEAYEKFLTEGLRDLLYQDMRVRALAAKMHAEFKKVSKELRTKIKVSDPNLIHLKARVMFIVDKLTFLVVKYPQIMFTDYMTNLLNCLAEIYDAFLIKMGKLSGDPMAHLKNAYSYVGEAAAIVLNEDQVKNPVFSEIRDDLKSLNLILLKIAGKELQKDYAVKLFKEKIEQEGKEIKDVIKALEETIKTVKNNYKEDENKWENWNNVKNAIKNLSEEPLTKLRNLIDDLEKAHKELSKDKEMKGASEALKKIIENLKKIEGTINTLASNIDNLEMQPADKVYPALITILSDLKNSLEMLAGM